MEIERCKTGGYLAYDQRFNGGHVAAVSSLVPALSNFVHYSASS